MSYEKIISDLKQKKFQPVYFLSGEEPYFIDQISEYIEHNVLEEHERDFNQTIFYGKDAKVSSIIETCKRFPMMSERQVVIIKEAQHLAKDIGEFEDYLNNPQPSTLLVFCYKYKKIDKRKAVGKLIAKNSVFLVSDKIKDYKLPEWILGAVKNFGFSINQKNAMLLSEYLGNDLGKIEKELEKLKVVIKPGSEINGTVIENNIGISKDYNIFELQNAIGNKDVVKANTIINYFSKNEKAHPLVLTVGFLFSYFSKVITVQFSKNKSNDVVLAREVGVNPYFLKDYKIAIRNYSPTKLVKVIGYLRESDLKSKGVNNSSTTQSDLLKELIFKIMH
ncbi:DNA polymerase III subunit delta [Flavobacteriales bacterium]|nr:DNA polymerase III subunit delta [Flavobacteriales bacterium]